MEIVYAAEKPSIAKVLSDRLHLEIGAQDIEVRDNPNETGSFLVNWRCSRYIVTPSGAVECMGASFDI
jgi:hypothetical protein